MAVCEFNDAENWNEDRMCFNCGYSLRGLAYPTRCPECAAVELPLDVLQTTLQGVHWRRLVLRAPFLSRVEATSLWQAVMHPKLKRASKRRVLFLVIACVALVAAVILLCNWWVYKLPQPLDSQVYVQRCWWYEVTRESAPFLVDPRASLGGNRIVHEYTLWTNWQALPGKLLHLAKEQAFYFISRTFVPAWLLLLIAWPLLCSVVLRADIWRAIRMLQLLSVSFMPVVVGVLLIIVAKIAYMLFYVDEILIQALFGVHLLLCLWPGITYTRAIAAVGSKRWAAYLCASVTLVISILWPMRKCLYCIAVPEYAMSWI